MSPSESSGLAHCSVRALIDDVLIRRGVTILVYFQDHLEQPSSAALGVGNVLVEGPSAGASCPGSVLQAGGVCTWPCVSDPGSRAAAGAAAAPPSGVGEVSGRCSVLDLGTPGRGKGVRFLPHGPEASYAVEERRPAASLGAALEGHT